MKRRFTYEELGCLVHDVELQTGYSFKCCPNAYRYGDPDEGMTGTACLCCDDKKIMYGTYDELYAFLTAIRLSKELHLETLGEIHAFLAGVKVAKELKGGNFKGVCKCE